MVLRRTKTAERLYFGDESSSFLLEERKECKIQDEPKPPSDPKTDERPEKQPTFEENYRIRIVWRNVIFLAYIHFAAIYGTYLMFTSAKIQTIVWAFLVGQASALGITAGAHRLWSHRSYKAKWPLKCILIAFNSTAFQASVYDWVRDHRVHHEYIGTNADPYNAKRGFFSSYVGWLLCRKHPDVIEKRRSIDVKDLDVDDIIQFQKRHYLKMVFLFCFLIPTLVPVYFWGETWSNAWYVATMWRLVIVANITWLVSNVTHIWGHRPNDSSINAAENPGLAIVALGEGWHNFHYVFPWDYRASELGNRRVDLTTCFIDLFAKIGWAYDLRTVPLGLVQRRSQRSGAKTRESHKRKFWGWGKRDLLEEDTDRSIVWQI